MDSTFFTKESTGNAYRLRNDGCQPCSVFKEYISKLGFRQVLRTFQAIKDALFDVFARFPERRVEVVKQKIHEKEEKFP